MKQLNPIEVKAISVYIDCEGTISLSKGRTNPAVYHVLRIVNTDRRICDDIMNIVGVGKVFGPYTKKPYKDTGGFRKTHNWRPYYNYSLLNAKSLLALYEQIHTSLLCKKAQAELCIEFFKSRQNHRYDRNYSCRELEIVELVIGLNKRGKTYLNKTDG